LLVGVGPGLGYALARRLVDAGMNVALASRDAERLDHLVAALGEIAHDNTQIIRAYGCDATSETSIKHLVSLVAKEIGTPHFMAYATQGVVPGRALDLEASAFEECWRQNCLGAFIAARETARGMVALQRGTIVLIGSTSSIIGRTDHLSLAVGKFGLRAVSQVMARELWPSGVHVVHLVIDADIKEDELHNEYVQAKPEDIASSIHALHRQPRSAWASEVDIRPFNEKWWEHC
jgi:NAD(P)-dependent dehydrogenase (short-subunit alcohol dehydrogenase family)